MMLYKIGDIVRIKEGLGVGIQYGDPPIELNYDMSKELGKVGVITDISEEESAVKVCGWWWSTAMIDLFCISVPPKFWIPIEDGTPAADPDQRYIVICENKKGKRNINLAWIDENGTWHGQGSFAKVTHWMTVQLPEAKDGPV